MYDGDSILNSIEIPVIGRYFYDFIGDDINYVKVSYNDEIIYERDVEEELQRESSQFFFKEEKTDTFDVNFNFMHGPFIEIISDSDREFNVQFIDNEASEIVHEQDIRSNCWVKANREYYTDWHIKIESDNVKPITIKQNLDKKNVMISFESSSLGDTLAWIPYVEEFRKKHNCNIVASTFWNKILDYPNLIFIEPGEMYPNIYTRYEIGAFDSLFKNVNHWMDTPLQKIASDILGLDYMEIRPKVKISPNTNYKVNKYIAISEHSTALCKYWNYKGGWKNIVDYINSTGFTPMVISKEKTALENVENRTGRSIFDTMENIKECRLVITLSNGLAWLAWAIGIPVIMISGCTEEWNEFTCDRIINKNVCHGCLNNSKNTFDKGNWLWCPENKNFQCTKEIHPNDVIKMIEKYK
jgi:autotransporter strand-loop-strand O-heptosyltransferase